MQFRIGAYRDKAFILSRVEKDGECWKWTKSTCSGGYGHFNIHVGGRLKTIRAHRAAYELFKGVRIPAGMVVMHSCDNRRCCNPDHLKPGTLLENIADMKRKGRAVGHPLESNPKAKLTAEDVKRIRSAPKRHGVIAALARKYGISRVHIWRLRNGMFWPAQGANKENCIGYR